MSASAGKIVIVGLELGDGPRVHEWAQAGLLPAIKELADRGCWRWLETTAEQLHISAWPSLYTGAPPGEHGVYYTHQPAPGLQGYQRFHPGLYGRPTFWKVLDEAGRRCTVFDPPYSHPEEGFGGTFVYDWGSWAHYLEGGSVPQDALPRLRKECGEYPLGIEAHDLGLKALEPRDVGRRLVAAVDAKTSATCWLMKQQPWNLVFTVYGETHVAGHYCWPDGMLEVYQALDRGIARIREAAGDDALFMVVSGDAVGANHAGWHLLPDVMEKLGYFMSSQAAAQAGAAAGAAPAKRKGFDPVKALRDLLPKEFRKSLARMLPTHLRDKLAQRVDMADVEWSRTRAYCLPTDLEGCIRVNLKGREPLGIVEPGAEYEALLDDIERELCQLRDAATGEPIVREVIRVDRAFPGHRRAYLPDLLVSWRAARPIEAVTSPRVGTLSKPSPDPRPGTHAGPGFALAAGPGVSPGAPVKSGHIMDLAPTVLSRLGVAVPAHVRGRAWPEVAGT